MPFQKGNQINLGKKNRLGHKNSPEQNRKIGLANSTSLLGKKQSKQVIEKRIRHQIGDKNWIWKGDKVSYTGLHHWIRREKGTPKYCEHCKRTDKKRYEWANVDNLYRRKLSDYIRLCSSCHIKYDRERKDRLLLVESFNKNRRK